MQKQISIGNFIFELHAEEERFWAAVDVRYHDFYSDDNAPVDEVIEMEIVPDATFAGLDPSQTEIHHFADTVQMRRGKSLAIWDKKQHFCLVKQGQGHFSTRGDHADFAVDSMLRIMVADKLLEESGCLIHSAGIKREGQGFLFPGKSGAGKSTVSSLSAAQATILSDDLNLILRKASRTWLHGTPFYGSFKMNTRDSAPLAGIYFLNKAQENKLIPLSTKNGLRRLLQSVVYFNDAPGKTNQVLQLVRDICQYSPCFILDFRKDDSFWRLIDES